MAQRFLWQKKKPGFATIVNKYFWVKRLQGSRGRKSFPGILIYLLINYYEAFFFFSKWLLCAFLVLLYLRLSFTIKPTNTCLRSFFESEWSGGCVRFIGSSGFPLFLGSCLGCLGRVSESAVYFFFFVLSLFLVLTPILNDSTLYRRSCGAFGCSFYYSPLILGRVEL